MRRSRTLKHLQHRLDHWLQNDWVERILLPVGVMVAFVMIWQGLAQMALTNEFLLPGPLQVARAIGELYHDGVLWVHARSSLLRVFVGFTLAALLAIPLGMLLGWNRRLSYAFLPMIQMLKTISPIAWIPLAILWLGIGDRPAVFIIFMAAFFPILIATAHANRHIEPAIIKTAINFGAGGYALFAQIILPASFPYIMVGLRIALGISWVVIVAAEMVGMRSGLGFMILDARNALRTDLVIAGMVIIGVIGVLLDGVMGWIERRVESHRLHSQARWAWKE